MTIKELIEILESFPEYLPVLIDGESIETIGFRNIHGKIGSVVMITPEYTKDD